MNTEQQLFTPQSFHDPLFKEERLTECFLSVQTGDSGFSYALFDGRTRNYIGWGELKIKEKRDAFSPDQPVMAEVHMAQAVQAFPWLVQPFKSSKVIWEGEKFTLVPDHLFQEAAALDILAFNTTVDTSEVVKTDQLTTFKARNIFALPEKAFEIIKRTLRVERVVHHTSVLVLAIAQVYQQQLQKARLFLNIREGHFDVVVMDHTTLHFLNSFFFRKPEDLVYFTLFSLDQLGIKPDQAEVTLMGAIQKNTPLIQYISKYLRKVECAERNPLHAFCPVFNHLPDHAFFPLLNLNSCGL